MEIRTIAVGFAASVGVVAVMGAVAALLGGSIPLGAQLGPGVERATVAAVSSVPPSSALGATEFASPTPTPSPVPPASSGADAPANAQAPAPAPAPAPAAAPAVSAIVNADAVMAQASRTGELTYVIEAEVRLAPGATVRCWVEIGGQVFESDEYVGEGWIADRHPLSAFGLVILAPADYAFVAYCTTSDGQSWSQSGTAYYSEFIGL